MRKLPESELELMMIIWKDGRPVTRTDIEQQLPADRRLSPTTILSFLTRLENKGFLAVRKQGKNNVYEALVGEQEYLQAESGTILKSLYRNSVHNFMTALYEGDHMSAQDLEELQSFLDEKRNLR